MARKKTQSYDEPPQIRSKLPWALPLGALFAFGVFLFLAWLQPVAADQRRIDLPEQFSFKFKLANKKPPIQKPKEKELEPKPKKKKRKPQKTQKKRPSKARPQKTVRAVTNRSVAPRAGASSIGSGINIAAGGTGGGGPMVIGGFDNEAAAVYAEVAELQEYKERSAQARRAMEERTSRRPVKSANATEPVPTFLPKPRYPAKARQNQIEGWVELRLLINREGKVEQSKILDSDPPNVFDDAIRKVLPRWTLRPATDEKGRPVEATMDYTYEFSLEG